MQSIDIEIKVDRPGFEKELEASISTSSPGDPVRDVTVSDVDVEIGLLETSFLISMSLNVASGVSAGILANWLWSKIAGASKSEDGSDRIIVILNGNEVDLADKASVERELLQALKGRSL